MAERWYLCIALIVLISVVLGTVSLCLEAADAGQETTPTATLSPRPSPTIQQWFPELDLPETTPKPFDPCWPPRPPLPSLPTPISCETPPPTPTEPTPTPTATATPVPMLTPVVLPPTGGAP